MSRYLLGLLLLLGANSQAQVTRLQENDSSIIYSGTWYTNTESPNSGGRATLTNAKGAQAVITFNGTGITWIGVSDPFSGIAWVYLDGTFNTVDTYSAGTLFQQPLFKVSGLPRGLHTLSIEVPHLRDGSTQGSWVWIDAFDIENGSAVTGASVPAGRAEQNNPAMIYTGIWFSKTGPQYSGGSVVLATDPGSRATVTFNGAGITWIGFRDEWSGIARVYVDGALQATVDTYLSPAAAQAPVYSVNGLASSTHTLTIEATGTHSSISQDSWVWVDAFDVTGSGSSSTPAPVVNAGGVVNGASYAPANQAAPGEIISIFGNNFLVSGRAEAMAMPLPTQLGPGNTTVTACGRSLPLYNVFPAQINAQMPFECSGSTPLTVTASGQTSAAQTVTVVSGSPGIFTLNGSGTGDGAIFRGDNSLVTSTNPARGGEQVVIYCTGLGLTSPAFATGSQVTGMNRTVNPVTVTIGGRNAPVAYSGLTVGFAGLYQVNVVVPSGLSGTQPIVVTAGNTSRAGVTIAVAP